MDFGDFEFTTHHCGDKILYKLRGASHRGRDKIFDNAGYSYNLKLRRHTDKYKIWKCSVTHYGVPCPRSLKEMDGTFTLTGQEHTCEPQPEAILQTKISHFIKHRAQENPTLLAHTIGEEARKKFLTSENLDSDLMNITALTQRASYHIQKVKNPRKVKKPQLKRRYRPRRYPEYLEGISEDSNTTSELLIAPSDQTCENGSEVLPNPQNDNLILQEVSLDEMQPPKLEYRVAKGYSLRGHDKLYDSAGYSYSIKKINQKSIDWRCSVRTPKNVCSASVSQKGDQFTPGHASHNHPPKLHAEFYNMVLIKAKKMAIKHPLQCPGTIVRTVLKQCNCQKVLSRSQIDNLKAAIGRYKLNCRQQQELKTFDEFDVVVDEQDNIKAAYFQTDAMKFTYDKFPELLIVEDTHKLKGMPVIVLLTIDGYGICEIVCVFVAVTNEAEHLSCLLEMFKQRNQAWSLTKIFLTDSKSPGKEVYNLHFPNAEMQICPYHAIQSIKADIGGKNFSRVCIAEKQHSITRIQKIMKSQYEAQYTKNIKKLEENCGKLIVDYFMQTWHTIAYQWVFGLNQWCFYNETTNKRLDKIMSQIRLLVCRTIDFHTFFENCDWVIKFFQKKTRKVRSKLCSKRINLFPKGSAEFKFYRVLTPHASKVVSREISLSQELAITQPGRRISMSTSSGIVHVNVMSCTCQFSTLNELPCCHLFALRAKLGMDLYLEDLIGPRWKLEIYGDEPTLMDTSLAALEEASAFLTDTPSTSGLNNGLSKSADVKPQKKKDKRKKLSKKKKKRKNAESEIISTKRKSKKKSKKSKKLLKQEMNDHSSSVNGDSVLTNASPNILHVHILGNDAIHGEKEESMFIKSVIEDTGEMGDDIGILQHMMESDLQDYMQDELVCQYCSERFQSVYSLRLHVRRDHSNAGDVAQPESSSKRKSTSASRKRSLEDHDYSDSAKKKPRSSQKRSPTEWSPASKSLSMREARRLNSENLKLYQCEVCEELFSVQCFYKAHVACHKRNGEM